ncbi:hypothetical protein Tco_0607818 [Tanacetum coccineum]
MASPSRIHTKPCLSNSNLVKPRTDNNNKIGINKEILAMLQDHAYNGGDAKEAADHITKFLEIIDLVKILRINKDQLYVFAFPYSLFGKARRWWMHEGNNKITTWVELVDKFFYKYYPLSRASRINCTNEERKHHYEFMHWLSSKFKNPWKLNTATKNALWNFCEKGYDNNALADDDESSEDENNESDHQDTNPIPDPSDEEKGYESHHSECNSNSGMPEYFNTKHSKEKEQPNNETCRVDKFEVIKYSIGDKEEFMGLRTLERHSWAQTTDGVSSVYLDIFRKKDEGWTAHRTK